MSAAPSLDWRQAPLGPGVRVLRSHASGVVAVEKPAGVLSHPNTAADRPRALLAAAYDGQEQCYAWVDTAGVTRRAWLLHRLDSATSGVLLLADRPSAAAAVRAAFEARGVHKRYLAVVLGHPRERQSRWRDSLAVQREGGAVRATTRGGAPAETAMRCLRLIPGPPALALLELEPLTGRTHQLRVQCARRHLPILGDQNYGDFKRNRDLARRFGTDRLFLHARAVELACTIDGARVSFAAESPPPPEFAAFLPAR